MNNRNFNHIEWHDLIVKDVKIDRSNPGRKDELYFTICDNDNGVFSLSFKEVYWANLHLNFGIISEETILNACELDDTDEDLQALYKKWNNTDLGNLKVYKMVLNATNSIIKIIAKDFELTEKTK